jgi:hypothetical protein
MMAEGWLKVGESDGIRLLDEQRQRRQVLAML